MSRIKVSEEKKAAPQSFSLTPKHIAMLDKLGVLLRDSRSGILQKMIEDKYIELSKDVFLKDVMEVSLEETGANADEI